MTVKSRMLKYTAVMTAVNLIMKSVAVSFNAYLTARIGTEGIGLFQLIMSVYSLAVTAASAGVKLSSMRMTVELTASGKSDLFRTLSRIIGYALFCSTLTMLILIVFSDFISIRFISDASSARALRILALSLPFVSISSALGGYFTAIEKIPQFSSVQLIEQGFKIAVTVILINRIDCNSTASSICAIAAGMTAAEMFSASLSMLLKRLYKPESNGKRAAEFIKILRIALPDGAGTFLRSLLLTAEHLLIPKCLKRNGNNTAFALSAYGAIHGMALPVLLYPNAVLLSFSTLLISDLARKNEKGLQKQINNSVKKNLKRTFFYSAACGVFFFFGSETLSMIIYKNNEAAQYIKILAPLVPVMYLDTVTDGMLKGLDQQIHSMRYNIFDSALCIALVCILLPKYSVKGYIFILYLSELINFYLSFSRLTEVCDIEISGRIKAVLKPQEDNPIHAALKKRSGARTENEYRTYQGREKRSRDLRFCRKKGRIQDPRV